MKVLNIFCDASITQDLYGVTSGCSGYIAYVDNKVIDSTTRFIYNCTNNYSEITAVLMGVNKALQEQHNYDVINLFSDSQLCIFGLREWIYNWVSNIYNGIMYNSNRDPVANQYVYSEIINTICRNRLNINLYHQKGHISVSSEKSIRKAIETFQRSNNISIDRQTAIDISNHNNDIDVLTRKHLLNVVRTDPNYAVDLVYPAYYDITSINIAEYKKLLNRSKFAL